MYVIGMIVGLHACDYIIWDDNVEASSEFMAHFTIGASSENPRCILP
jgi:hypothetical protein